METIIKVIEKRLNDGHSKTTFTFLENGEIPQPAVSFNDLRKKSLNLASALSKDKTVLLLLPQGIDFIAAFLG